MALQSHAALAEVRDTLLETYASNDAMNQLILSNLDPRAWRAQPLGQKGSGRTIAAIFAHLHNSRLVWLKNSAPHLKCPPPLDPDRCTMKQAAAAHKKRDRKSTRLNSSHTVISYAVFCLKKKKKKEKKEHNTQESEHNTQ